MHSAYLLKNITEIRPESASDTGHTTHRARYKTKNQHRTIKIPIIYKENKNGDPQSSLHEVAFSELARLIMSPHATPTYHLVKDDITKSITGVASDDISLSIAQQVNSAETRFLHINYLPEQDKYSFHESIVHETKNIPYTFLNTLPHGFFAYLMAEKNKGTISIDMDSLASLFTGKYTMEEDDLHKGNMGFYTVLKEGKPHVVFFNIDHDLSLSDSLTSFLDSRFLNWTHGANAFPITARDLRNFPDILDSENYYWPTRQRFLVKWNDDKTFVLDEELRAFQNLKHDPEFIRYKWKRFLKHILIPEQLMKQALNIHFNPNDPFDVAEINLITQAMHERVIKLRAVLLSLPEFRSYLHSQQGQEDIQRIQDEVSAYLQTAFPTDTSLTNRIQEEINKKAGEYFDLGQVQHGDTPLHCTLRLQSYRFEQSQKAFYMDLNTPNEQGERPIDVAAKRAQSYQPGSEKINPGRDPLLVIKHLVAQGAEITPAVSQVLAMKGITLKDYHFRSQYYERTVAHYSDLKKVISDIGQDDHLSLKAKKIISVKVSQMHLNKLTEKELSQFKSDLNGAPNKPIAPELLFISQLRSNLWIVRVIRGLYGNSSTRMELNNLIDETKPYVPSSGRDRFFSKKNPVPLEEEEQLQPNKYRK